MFRQSLGSARSVGHQISSSINTDEIPGGDDSVNFTEKYDTSSLAIDHDDFAMSEKPNDLKSCPYGCCRRVDLSDHVLTRGLLEGKYSDVVVEAFGTKYNLHKLFLDRSGYFRSLFNWNEDNAEQQASDSHFSVTFDDEYITKESFELALSRIYGAANYAMEAHSPHHMIAVGSYLDIDDLVCTSTERVIQLMNMDNVSKFVRFATTNHYGPASDKIVDSAKGVLSAMGWEFGAAKWDGIPEEVIADVVGEDCFFVPSEWDRCMFIIKLIERRTVQTDGNQGPDNESVSSVSSALYDAPLMTLRNVLKEKVHYCHLSAEQLQQLSDFNDINGVPYIDAVVLHEALWKSFSLFSSIMKSMDLPNLGLAISSDNEETGVENGWYRVPVRDETICGTPSVLRNLMSEHQYALANSDTTSSVNEGEFKAPGASDESNNSKVYSWTKVPPFRFSIAFANASDLSTEKRVYAKTLWYAGSYWNLYLQKVKVKQKKGFQMGVYLHRASAPSSSARNGLVNPDVYVDNINYMDPPINYGSRASAQAGVVSLSANSGLESGNEEKENVDDDTLLSYLENLDLGKVSNKDTKAQVTSPTKNQAHQSRFEFMTSSPQFQRQDERSFLYYDDTRSKISVYFAIMTPSRRAKSTITSFVSAPDTFNKSQSWGWKSNSMCVFNEDGTFPEGHEKHLKFMVVLGNI